MYFRLQVLLFVLLLLLCSYLFLSVQYKLLLHYMIRHLLIE